MGQVIDKIGLFKRQTMMGRYPPKKEKIDENTGLAKKNTHERFLS